MLVWSCVNGCLVVTPGVGHYLEDLGLDGTIILNLIVKK